MNRFLGTLLVCSVMSIPIVGNMVIGKHPSTTGPLLQPLVRWTPPACVAPSCRMIDGTLLSRVTWKRKKLRKLTCDIIAEDKLEVFAHELAHCNGWDHPTGATYPVSPKDDRYFHAFNGKLRVTIAENGDPTLIRRYAQPGTRIDVSPKSAARLCTERAKGSYKYPANTGGCAPVFPPLGKTNPGVVSVEVLVRENL